MFLDFFRVFTSISFLSLQILKPHIKTFPLTIDLIEFQFCLISIFGVQAGQFIQEQCRYSQLPMQHKNRTFL